MKAVLTVTMDNAAFAEDWRPELGRILAKLARQVDVGEGESLIAHDINGNRVGELCIEEEESQPTAGRAAIEKARRTGCGLYKYADDTEPARAVTIEEAEDIVQEDPSLIYTQPTAGHAFVPPAQPADECQGIEGVNAPILHCDSCTGHGAPDDVNAEMLGMLRELSDMATECGECAGTGKEDDREDEACHSCGGVGEHLDAGGEIGDIRDIIARAEKAKR